MSIETASDKSSSPASTDDAAAAEIETGNKTEEVSEGARRYSLQISAAAYERLGELSKLTGFNRTTIAEHLLTYHVIDTQIRNIKTAKLVARRPGRARKTFHTT